MAINIDGLATIQSGSAAPNVAPGAVAPIGSLYLQSTGVLWHKTAAGDTAWVSLTVQLGSPQRFTYTVTGAEPDLTALTIALPAARATATYEVYWSQGQATNLLAAAVLTASKTVNQFVLQLSGAATAGDIFNFFVVDGT